MSRGGTGAAGVEAEWRDGKRHSGQRERSDGEVC